MNECMAARHRNLQHPPTPSTASRAHKQVHAAAFVVVVQFDHQQAINFNYSSSHWNGRVLRVGVSRLLRGLLEN